MGGFLSVTKRLQDKQDKKYLEKKSDTNTDNITVNSGNITVNANNLTVHKSSADHDSRYYTQSEVDALIASNYLYLTLSANQTTNLTAGNEVEFNTSSGTISYNSTTHRATLESGKTYVLEGLIHAAFSTAGDYVFRWYDVTNAAYVGQGSRQLTPDSTTQRISQPVAFALITPASNIDVELRVEYVSGTPTAIIYSKSHAYIKELK